MCCLLLEGKERTKVLRVVVVVVNVVVVNVSFSPMTKKDAAV